MIKSVMLFFCCMCSAVAMAQPMFVPDTEIIKVGEVLFQRPKTVSFGFVNKGDSPLQIVSVTPSCGCLDVQFPNASVKPGERGEIKVTYDAKLLGTFYKDLEIVTNSSEKPIYLAMQGCVVTTMQDFSNDYPIDLGNVRMATNYLEFEDVNKGETPYVELPIVNAERMVYRPELMHLPPYLSAEYLPESIPAGKEGIIRLTLHSDKLPMFGLNQTSIYLARYLGDKINESNEIQISAVLLPDVSHFSPGEYRPKLSISETHIDMGEMATETKKTKTVVLQNNGDAPLHIEKVQVFNKAISVSLNNRTIKPGKSSKLKITAHAKYLKEAKGRPRVLLISDDPNQTKALIHIEVKP